MRSADIFSNIFSGSERAACGERPLEAIAVTPGRDEEAGRGRVPMFGKISADRISARLNILLLLLQPQNQQRTRNENRRICSNHDTDYKYQYEVEY